MCECIENKIKSDMKEILGKYQNSKDNLIQILHS